jgi:hypothetical protein
MLFRCITKNPAGQERSILILWDGKKTRSIETNPWLDGL